MKLNINEQPIAITRILLFNIGIMLSCNVFAVQKVTQAEFDAEATARQTGDDSSQANIDAEATARQTGDNGLQAQIDALQAQIDALPSNVFYEIGDPGPAGGIVFWVTEDRLHGLEAAPTDQGTAMWGGCDGEFLAFVSDIGTGEQNTINMLYCFFDGSPAASPAASMAFDYELNGFTDWFLPSQNELIEMINNIGSNPANNFAIQTYWSSTEWTAYDAMYYISFLGGTPQLLFDSKINTHGVRAARAF